MARSLLAFALILLSPRFTNSAGKCDLSAPPKSWLVTTGIGIQKWGTAGASSDGDQFCITGDPSSVVEVDYHVDLSDDVRRDVKFLSRHGREHWDNPYNMCVVDDPQIHVCFPLCAEEPQPMIIQAALSYGYPQGVADSIAKSLNSTEWAIAVLQVDFNNPAAKLNVTMYADPNVWCSVYIGIDPKLGFPYLYEIQLVKVIQGQ